MEDNNLELVLQRLDGMEDRMKEHLGMCQKLCLSQIQHVEQVANKAHTRLDSHKDTIQCITDWKNQMKGRMWAVPFIIAPVSAAVTAVVIKVLT